MFSKLFKKPDEQQGKNLQLFIQFFKFGIVGLSNTIIAYVVYVLLLQIGIYYIIANVISFFAGTINSFFWNNKFVFKRHEKNVYLPFIRTVISYAITGLVLANLLLYFFVEILNISKYLAPLLNLIVTVPANFVLNKFWVFKEHKAASETSVTSVD